MVRVVMATGLPHVACGDTVRDVAGYRRIRGATGPAGFSLVLWITTAYSLAGSFPASFAGVWPITEITSVRPSPHGPEILVLSFVLHPRAVVKSREPFGVLPPRVAPHHGRWDGLFPAGGPGRPPDPPGRRCPRCRAPEAGPRRSRTPQAMARPPCRTRIGGETGRPGTSPSGEAPQPSRWVGTGNDGPVGTGARTAAGTCPWPGDSPAAWDVAVDGEKWSRRGVTTPWPQRARFSAGIGWCALRDAAIPATGRCPSGYRPVRAGRTGTVGRGSACTAR